MDANDLRRWAEGLRSGAGDAAESLRARVFPGDRTARTPLLVWKGLAALGAQTQPTDRDPDAALWWAVCGATTPPPALQPDADGPLFPQGATRAIEVWTETELSALQALWWLSRREGGARLGVRMRAAARWHLDNTQPDNATNRPWAIPVYLELAADEGSFDARLYAETLLHNARAGNGQVEPFSAAILLDAADAVDLMLASR